MATQKSAAGPTTKKPKDDLGPLNIRLYDDGSFNMLSPASLVKGLPSNSVSDAVVERISRRLSKPKPVIKTRRVKVVEKVRVTEQEQWMEEALAALPKERRPTVKLILNDPELNEGVGEMFGRAGEMRHPVTALLAGIWMHKPSRSFWENSLDTRWASTSIKSSYDEVIVGSGIHAAIYCAVRAKLGFPKPLVLEKNERAGGSFAMTEGPAFFLNSRNRAGELSVPGDLSGALNVLPGAMLQPSDLSSAEYITNDVLAFAIRACLAMYADVATSVEVTSLGANYEAKYTWDVKFGARGKARAKRVLRASGLGAELRFLSSDRLFTFSEFMKRMDTTFPLQGLERVAVIGAGDSGKTAIEALCGQGPQPNMSVASLDTPQMIDWYGPGASMNCTQWQEQNRTRFKRIGKLLRDANKPMPPQVRTFSAAKTVMEGYDRLMIGNRFYSHVIDCHGFNTEEASFCWGPELNGAFFDASGTFCLARSRETRENLFSIGAGSQIGPLASEIEFTDAIGENATSIFRYASRAAALAAKLPAP